MALDKNVPLAANQISADLTSLGAQWEELMKSSHIYAADAEASDTYVVTLDPAPTAYAAGMVVNFKANTANTGAATLNVNALGAKDIKKHNDVALVTGDIEAGQIVTLVYDGTDFQMQSQLGGKNAIKFWIHFDAGGGTPSTQDSYNVDSITDNGVGDYTINIDVDFADANYAVFVSSPNKHTASAVGVMTAGTIDVRTYNDSHAVVDSNNVMVCGMGVN